MIEHGDPFAPVPPLKTILTILAMVWVAILMGLWQLLAWIF